MGEQFLQGVIMPPQLLFVRNEIVNGPVTVPADVDSASQFFLGESLLEPLVAVQRARNKMMEVVSRLAPA
jgi:hypothetical protein